MGLLFTLHSRVTSSHQQVTLEGLIVSFFHFVTSVTSLNPDSICSMFWYKATLHGEGAGALGWDTAYNAKAAVFRATVSS